MKLAIFIIKCLKTKHDWSIWSSYRRYIMLFMLCKIYLPLTGLLNDTYLTYSESWQKNTVNFFWNTSWNISGAKTISWNFTTLPSRRAMCPTAVDVSCWRQPARRTAVCSAAAEQLSFDHPSATFDSNLTPTDLSPRSILYYTPKTVRQIITQKYTGWSNKVSHCRSSDQ